MKEQEAKNLVTLSLQKQKSCVENGLKVKEVNVCKTL
jgi:hypothetical protein